MSGFALLSADLDTFEIEKERYDLIANFYYLSRKLIPKMKKGLKEEESSLRPMLSTRETFVPGAPGISSIF